VRGQAGGFVVCHDKGAFTLGIRDFSVESPKVMLLI
jgi:hypothetical protein